MNYQDKTNVELTKELQKLQQEYDLLKTSYEKDITERKLAEEELPEPGILDKELMDLSRDVIFSLTPKGLFGSMNQAFEKITGWQTQEWIGKPFTDLLHPEDIPLAAERFSNMMKGHTAQAIELRIRKKSGDYGYTEVLASPRMKKGMITGLLGISRDITERKKAEEALHQSEKRYRNLFETASDSIFIVDRTTGNFVDANPAASRLYGYSNEEFLRITTRDVSAEPKKTKAAIGDGITQVPLRLHRRKDGTVFPVEITGSYFTQGGRNLHTAFIRDITERKQTEEALQEDEMKLKTLFKILPIGVSILDAERNVVFVNPALERILNMTKDGIIRGDYKNRKYLRPDGKQMPEEEYASVRAIREQRAVHDVETGVLMEDGHVIWTNVNAVPVAFPDWKVVIITADITERKLAKETLRESEERFRRLSQGLFEGIIIHDEGKIIDANEAFAAMFGYDLPELIGKNALDFATPELRKIAENHILTESEEPYEGVAFRKEGSMLDVEVRGKNIPYKGRMVRVTALMDITERKLAEEALHLEKENFRRSMEDSPLGVRIATIEGNTIYANKALLDFYGYDSFGELQKTPLKDRYTPESYLQAQERKHQRERGDLSATGYEISIVRKNREIRHLQVFRKEVLWDGVRQFQVICNDVTDRKHAEEALHESEERYRRLVEGSPEAIAVHSKGKFVFVNPAGAKLIGAGSPQELIGKPILGIVHPDSRNQVIERLRHVAEGKEAPLFEEKFLKFDGSVIDVEVVGIPFSYQGQIATQVVVHDITERKQVEVTLRKSEQKISEALEFNRKILDTSSIGILTYKKSGQCVSANQAAAKATGTSVAQLLAQNFHKISSWKKSGMYQAAIKALDTGIEQLLDVRLVTTFGKDVWLSFSFSSFDSEGEPHLLVFTSDINERKLAEEEIRKSTKLLEDLHKHLDEIRENERAMISREIHDQIGQSLTALKLDLNSMDKYIKNTNPEAAAKLEGMVELVTGTIKDVQRISSDLRPGILDDLGLAAAIEWYCGEFEKRTAVKCSLKLDDSIFGDPRKNLVFFRVLQEALTNVIRHANASSVTIKLHHTQKGTTLAIQDDGIGITGEKVESAKSLGLIGMRERVKQFGGKVNISSGEGLGTKLTIFIPSK